MSRRALFHGTAHWFRPGDRVNPTVPATGIVSDAAAWGTPHLEVAAHYSAHKSSKASQPPLFSPIYEVETTSDQLRTHPKIDSVGDRKGMRVKGLAGYASYEGEVM